MEPSDLGGVCLSECGRDEVGLHHRDKQTNKVWADAGAGCSPVCVRQNCMVFPSEHDLYLRPIM